MVSPTVGRLDLVVAGDTDAGTGEDLLAIGDDFLRIRRAEFGALIIVHVKIDSIKYD